MKENRVKLYFISQQEVLSRILQPFPKMIAVVNHVELPDGYEVRSVHKDYKRGGFLFLIFHPSFPPVAEGANIPVICEFETINKIYKVIPHDVEEDHVEIRCTGCKETMLVVLGGAVEVQEKNENPYKEIYCEDCYRKQKELVDQIRRLANEGREDYERT